MPKTRRRPSCFFWPKKGRWPKVRAAGDSVGMAIRPTKFWRVNSATKPSEAIDV